MSLISFTDFVAGSVGGGLGLAVGQPFDTVKARLQAGTLSLPQTIFQLYRDEGIYGFYRGFFFPLLTTGLNNAVFFGAYGSTIQWLEKGADLKAKADHYYRNLCIASAFASVWQVLFACPVELVKIRQQTDALRLTTVQVLSDIYKRDGPFGIFRGITPMMFRDVPTGCVYIIVYESLSDYFAGPNLERGVLGTCFAGGVAGVCSWMPVVPMDVVQTRMMADTTGRYRGMVHCFRESLKAEGWRGLFQGASLIGIRAFPVNAAIFLGYEKTKSFMDAILQ